MSSESWYSWFGGSSDNSKPSQESGNSWSSLIVGSSDNSKPSQQSSNSWSSLIVGSSDKSKSPQESNESWHSWLVGIATSKQGQSRFSWIPSSKLNEETVAGIRDNTIGKHGKNVVRFDTGAKSGQSAHINLDWRGYPNQKNPPIEVPNSVVSGAACFQKTMEYLGPLLTVLAYGSDAYRIGKAAKSDYDYNLLATQEDIRKEKALLLLMRFDDLALECCKEHLNDIKKPIYFTPHNTVRTIFSIVGGMTGGMVGATAGAVVGTFTGGVAGMPFGPPGSLVGSMIGSVAGSVSAAVTSASYGAAQGEKLADKLPLSFDINSVKGKFDDSLSMAVKMVTPATHKSMDKPVD